MSQRPKNPVIATIFWLVILFLYTPLLCVIAQSFLTDPYDWKSALTLKWLKLLLTSNTLWGPLTTSLYIGICSASLSVALGTLGAVGLYRRSQALTPWTQTLITLPILVPEVITGLSLLLFFLLARIPLGYTTVILAHASFSASFVYFVMVEQLRKLDPQLEEAAQDLGAEPETVFWRMTLPNILPGLVGGWLLAFTLSFDDFLISFFTTGAGVTTLPLKIYSLMRIGITPELNSLCFVLIAISTTLVGVLIAREESRQWVLKG